MKKFGEQPHTTIATENEPVIIRGKDGELDYEAMRTRRNELAPRDGLYHLNDLEKREVKELDEMLRTKTLADRYGMSVTEYSALSDSETTKLYFDWLEREKERHDNQRADKARAEEERLAEVDRRLLGTIRTALEEKFDNPDTVELHMLLARHDLDIGEGHE